MQIEQMVAEITHGIKSAIEHRFRSEVLPQVHHRIDAIIADEISSVAVRIARQVSFKSMDDRLVIEVRMPDVKV